MLVTCRSFAEYVAFFDLDVAALAGSRVLDCSAGAASFAAEAAGEGITVVAADPAYALGRAELAQHARDSLDAGNAIAAAHPGRFTWSWYGDEPGRDRLRRQALSRFLLDLATRPQRYVAAALPRLPFRDGAFDLALCSHLIFTWADQLGRDWHLSAVTELVRVAREVRVFPTVVQGAGEPVPFWADLMTALDADGVRTSTRRVPYEFQVGADSMLVLSR